ncbi:PadR family transcriptional regulator [Alicyclobacillaceae bacterium I2511]|nr:PadR family transcriptional regulator [Alicyclobacillaceae bacterium I2511]
MALNSKQTRHLPAFLLLFLNDGPAHGGILWSRMAELVPSVWNVDTGAVYRVLRDLEARGAVNSHWDTQGAGPAKRVYVITPMGREELQEWYQDILARKRSLDFFIHKYEHPPEGPTSEGRGSI